MSGSLPHTIALSNHTPANTTQPGYVPFDLRSDEDISMTALNARNAKASSDHIVTLSEQGQALSQRKQKKTDDVKTSKYNKLLEELEEEFIDDLSLLSHTNKKDIKTNYEEKTPTGDYLDQIV
ncbi:hypothetical protein MUS1_10230 [Marinomonas ushuaiensis DSM 15871]|uniref:Uncharacterized protein n=1 Tax=Marinomonas ushuaiensis DSM 15871 TaxID=1122207 RepID=X7E6X9_9GAMM|nr:hypothetical protein [Marinomonas ushuaiensis]ETX11635.1 hypothetical protein MUS1_10230 [Marinomonas ushuaiensis DSM 15871]